MDHSQIIISTKYFPPENQATGLLMSDVYNTLRDKGLNVSVYAGQAEGGSGSDTNITTVKYSRHSKTSKWGRILEEYSFFRAMGQKLKGIHEHSVLLMTTAPPCNPYIGVKLKKRNPGMKFILLVYDIYPDVALELGYISKLNPLVWASEYITRKSLKYANVIHSVSAASRS